MQQIHDSGYSNIRPLNEGGMGTLFLAHKDSLDIDVVIKRVKRQFRGRMNERAEADILKKLKHKYLPRIYDIILSPDGYMDTIMDYIQGVDMQRYVKQHGPVGQKLAYRWGCQLCEAVAYLHAQDPPILHCDIKPSNVMVTPSGDICVIDFNTSLVFSKGVLAIGATPGYAAPEQYARAVENSAMAETVPLEATMPLRGYDDAVAYRNRPQDSRGPTGEAYSATVARATKAGDYGTISKRTDVYGIGATLYYAVTGQRPAHSLEEVRPITTFKCGLSRSFEAIIARAMSKRQEGRFQDAQSMLEALQNVHLIDGRYKHVGQAQKAVAAVALLLAVAGAGLTALGVQRIGVERNMEYDSLVRSGRTAGEAMQFDDAARDLRRAVALYDDRLEAYVEQAVLLYRQGRYQECVDEIGSILTRPLQYESEQSVANLYYTAARSYDALEDYESAVRMYRQAMQYAPDQAIYYQGLVAAQLQLGDLRGAEAVLDDMTAHIPGAQTTAAYQVAAGAMRYRQGDYDAALAAALSAIAAGGEADQIAQAYLLAAEVYEARGDAGTAALLEEAGLLEEGLERLPALHYNTLAEPLAAVYVRLGEDDPAYLDKALDTYLQMQENGNSAFAVRLSTAIVQYRMEDFADAEQTLLALLDDYPDDYRVYKWLAFNADALMIRRGDRSAADAREYLAQADRLYTIARASGTSDPEMDELYRLADEWP